MRKGQRKKNKLSNNMSKYEKLFTPSGTITQYQWFYFGRKQTSQFEEHTSRQILGLVLLCKGVAAVVVVGRTVARMVRYFVVRAQQRRC